jgi:hypothetical protein
MRAAGRALLLGGTMSLLAGSLLAQPDFDFMPDGGRKTLMRVFGGSATELAMVASSQHDGAEWQRMVAAKAPDLAPEEIETLVSYLAVNMPLPAEAVGEAASTEELSATLPPDGKELAIANCQFCHSLFSGYLSQDRDVEGWRGVFKPPYHSELPMSARERETFSRYSAINMPIPYQDVPADLRF